ncbi:MAG: hypothetical protein ACRDTJ_03870 [Pseudonocardiaceae bacterium]
MTPAERAAAKRAVEEQFKRAQKDAIAEQAPARRAIRAHRRDEKQQRGKR